MFSLKEMKIDKKNLLNTLIKKYKEKRLNKY